MLDLGINFFDTANCYSARTNGEYLGQALRRHTNREHLIITTKVYFNKGKLSKNATLHEVKKSLKCQFQITENEKVGIIGENGSGKTTILKLIAGILKLNHCAGYPYAPVPPGYDEGFVKLSKGITCAYLEQIPQYDESLKVIDVLSFNEINQIETSMHELEKNMTVLKDTELKHTLKKYEELLSLYEMKGGYHVKEKLNKICTGLNFSDTFLEQTFQSLSGGERVRLTLSKILYEEVNLLILDEPTNHLDARSIESIEEALLHFKGTIFLVSHDRYFINKICNRVIEIEDYIFHNYNGNYENYRNEKEKQKK